MIRRMVTKQEGNVGSNTKFSAERRRENTWHDQVQIVYPVLITFSIHEKILIVIYSNLVIANQQENTQVQR